MIFNIFITKKEMTKSQPEVFVDKYSLDKWLYVAANIFNFQDRKMKEPHICGYFLVLWKRLLLKTFKQLYETVKFVYKTFCHISHMDS